MSRMSLRVVLVALVSIMAAMLTGCRGGRSVAGLFRKGVRSPAVHAWRTPRPQSVDDIVPPAWRWQSRGNLAATGDSARMWRDLVRRVTTVPLESAKVHADEDVRFVIAAGAKKSGEELVRLPSVDPRAEFRSLLTEKPSGEVVVLVAHTGDEGGRVVLESGSSITMKEAHALAGSENRVLIVVGCRSPDLLLKRSIALDDAIRAAASLRRALRSGESLTVAEMRVRLRKSLDRMRAARIVITYSVPSIGGVYLVLDRDRG